MNSSERGASVIHGVVDVVRPNPKMSPYGAPQRPAVGLSAKVRRVALYGIRRWGMLTARFRVDPDYLIIGTKRGGSTSLARWLLEHPQVKPLFPARETRKGTYFFDVNYQRGTAWYRSHFPTALAMKVARRRAGKPILVGEATPYYLHHPQAPTRARTTAPDTKVIALLRDPAARAYGHWGERTRNNVEWLPFDQALDAEESRLKGEEERMLADPTYTSFAHQHFSYVDQSRYDRGVSRWLNAWPYDQVLILRSEDLYDDPARTLGRVLDFLGLEPYQPDEFVAWNKKATSSIPADLEHRIRGETAESVANLEELLGTSMDWETES